MGENNSKKTILIAAVAIILGLAGGYYAGSLQGKKAGIVSGRQQVLDEQKAAQEAALKAAQEAANPFSDVTEKANPFKDVYKNPFAQ